MIGIGIAQTTKEGCSSPAVTSVPQPSVRFVSMAKKISKIDNVLKTMQEEDANDRLKLRELIDQADNLSTRVRNNFQRCVNIREEMNMSTGESSILVERKASPRKVHWCGPRTNNPENTSRSPQRKRSAERTRGAKTQSIKLPMTPNNTSFGQYEKAVLFRRRQPCVEKEKRVSQSMIVTRKTKGKSSLEAVREPNPSKSSLEAKLARARIRANILSLVILLAGLVLIYRLL